MGSKSLRTFGEFADEDGNLDRSFPSGGWDVPDSVGIDGDRIVWKMARNTLDRKHIDAPPADLLSSFLSLDVDKPKDICAYARKYGILEIGTCGRPTTGHKHKSNPPIYRVGNKLIYEHPLYGHSEYSACKRIGIEIDPDRMSYSGWEPLGAWRYYVRRARAILNLAANIRRKKLATRSDIATLVDQIPESEEEVMAWLDVPRIKEDLFKEYNSGEFNTLDYHRILGSGALNEWIDLASNFAGLRFSFMWRGDGAKYYLDTNHFGALGLQLGLAIAQSNSLATCSGCGSSYIPKRRPRSDQRNYCNVCRKRMIPQRDAMREHRARRTDSQG